MKVWGDRSPDNPFTPLLGANSSFSFGDFILDKWSFDCVNPGIVDCLQLIKELPWKPHCWTLGKAFLTMTSLISFAEEMWTLLVFAKGKSESVCTVNCL